MVQQIALGIEAHHLATRAESRVDTHHALLAQWGTQQQLTQILGKHADGLFVGLLLTERGKLVLDTGLEQALVAIVDGLGYQSAAGRVAIHVVALDALQGLVVVGRDADAQYALRFASAHGQQSVAGASLQRFAPIKVVTIFGGLVGIGLGLDHLRGDDGLALKGSS